MYVVVCSEVCSLYGLCLVVVWKCMLLVLVMLVFGSVLVMDYFGGVIDKMLFLFDVWCCCFVYVFCV